MFKVRALFVAAFFALTAMAATAQERITDFTVNIDVQTNGDIVVTEGISVISEGRSIRRGIFRDLPRYLVDDKGRKIEQKYDVLRITRGGTPETYRRSYDGNAMQIRVGSADMFLQNGAHDYVIQYRLPGAIRRFDSYDELYWNATGNYWKFPIERAAVNVRLPDGAIAKEVNGYTGRRGAQGKDYRATAKPGEVRFETRKPLGVREGLTVSVTLPKGVIAPLSAAQKRGQWWEQNGIFAMLGALLAAISGFYYRLWDKVGRDPVKPPVFARYNPPAGYSAAACRQIVKRSSHDHKGLIATLMGLAHKGYITLDAQKKVTTMTPIAAAAPDGPVLNTEEADLYKRLFGRYQNPVVLDGKTDTAFVSRISKFRSAIVKRYGPTYFKGNAGTSSKGILLSVIGGVLVMIFNPGGVTPAVIGLLGLLVLINLVMPFLIAAPTKKGQKLRAEIEGLKLYMETAEKGRINSARAPDDKTAEREPLMTADRYEELVPYAVALDVEKPWSQYFEKIMPVEAAQYRPTGMTGRVTPGDLSRTTRDMVSAVSSGVSSAAPVSSSSSGSGGGGSSGGGGGGGGGGGW